MSFKQRLPLILALPLLVGGCLNEPIGVRDAALGEAVKYDNALQVINPDPVYAEGAAQPGASGEHAVKATEAYRKGIVKPVETMRTTTGSTSGGGSGPQ